MDKFEALSPLEIVKLVDKKKARYCAITLNELEEIVKDKESYIRVRKVILDNYNNFARAMLVLAGIEIEGAST
jgi:hypothetical protein